VLSASEARFDAVIVALVPLRPVRPVVTSRVEDELKSFKEYEEALEIADQETEIDLRVLAVALRVGADGVERVEETDLVTVLVAMFADEVEFVAVLAKTLKL
jgi:hypothetical protein